MTERVRLLIWDLDDTFWRGALTEGGIAFIAAHKDIVVELARRGIVSSICSKNAFETVKAALVEHGVWDYFVLPSVSWAPKGPRIRDLIETIGLRAPTIMFLDDNPTNLEEARSFCPGLQTRGPEFIAHILDDPLFEGKDDRALTRLAQYKALELRRDDERAALGDPVQFLRDSEIEARIETDIEPHIDRFIELINRTNQLNFTKQRLPEDAEAARARVRELYDKYQMQVGLVAVRDRYGDHGFCGAYVHNSEGRRLEHFAFSCRILGLGVERWLYQKLGRPRIEVKGEVQADLFDPTPVDWVRQAEPGQVAQTDAPRIGRITARGSCEIGAIVHYFQYNSDDAVGEYHIFRDGGVFRIGHSVFLFHGARGLTPERREAAAKLGYAESDFATRLFDPTAHDESGHLVILGFSADAVYPLYRHRQSGLIVPFTAHADGWGERDVTLIPQAEEPERYPAWAREAMRSMRSEWDFLGLTRPSDFEALLRFAVAEIPSGAKIRLLAFFARDYLNAEGVLRRAPGHYVAFNEAMRRVAADFAPVEVIEVDDILDDAEIQDRLHFRRPGLFKIYRRIRDSVWR
jgi:FkbH-like protein